jgi:hypothetical protein
MKNVLDFKSWLNESYSLNYGGGMINEAFASPDFAAAAKAFKAKHKGAWYNVENQTLTYAGSKYFIALPVKPGSDGSLMDPMRSNVYEIRSNRYGVPLPNYAGDIWISEKGTATVNAENPYDPQVFYSDVTAGWKKYPSDDATAYTQFGCTGETWKSWLTKLGGTDTFKTTFRDHVTKNIALYKTQPAGFLGEIWLAIKPLVDEVSGVKPTVTASTGTPVKKP